jgi:hypothetical protein
MSRKGASMATTRFLFSWEGSGGTPSYFVIVYNNLGCNDCIPPRVDTFSCMREMSSPLEFDLSQTEEHLTLTGVVSDPSLNPGQIQRTVTVVFRRESTMDHLPQSLE